MEVVGLRVKYIGPGDDDKHAASIRTSDPVLDAFFYFEVEVLNKGRDGFIGALCRMLQHAGTSLCPFSAYPLLRPLA